MPSTSKDDRKPAKLASTKKQLSMDQKSHLRDSPTKNGLHSKTNTPSPRRARRKSDDASSNGIGTPKKRDLRKQISVDARSKAGSTGKINSEKKDMGKSPKTSAKQTSHSPSKSQSQAKAPLQRSVDVPTKPSKQGTLKKSPSQKSRTNHPSRTDDDEKDDSDNGSYHDSEDNIATAVSRINARASRKKNVSDDEEET